MGLSNYVPNSRISQAGVVDNTADRPASPYEGQLVYQRDTNQLLVWDGSAWVAPNSTTANPPGLELVKTETFTSQDPYDLTSVFSSSSYRSYQINMEVKGSATSALYAQFLSGTNTPFTSALYYRYGFYVTGGGVYNGYSAATQTNMFITNASTTYDSPISMTVFRPNISNRAYLFVQSFDPNSGLQIVVQHQVATTTQFTGMRFDAASGSISGTVSVYGYRN